MEKIKVTPWFIFDIAKSLFSITLGMTDHTFEVIEQICNFYGSLTTCLITPTE